MGRGKPLKKLKNDLVYIAVRGVIGLFRFIPRKPSLRIGSALGRFAPWVARKEHRLAVEHLTLAFGGEKSPEEIKRLARETFRYLAMNFVDTVRIRAMKREDVLAAFSPVDLGPVFAALKEYGGAIMLTSHAGCWEMMGAYLSMSGIPLAAIARRVYDSRLEKELHRSRSFAGVQVISRGHDTRDIVRCLKGGSLVAALIDQDTKVKGKFVDFFGKPAHTATSPAHLALRFRVPVIPFFTWRDESDKHHIHIGDPLFVHETGDRDRDVAVLTAECSRVIEDFIRKHPEQWVWFHRRWKTRPTEE